MKDFLMQYGDKIGGFIAIVLSWVGGRKLKASTDKKAAAQAGRDVLVNTFNFTITDGGVV